MRLLITGGSGYLGAAILKHAPHTWQIATTYFTHAITQENVVAIRVDVRDRNAVNHLFADSQPDAVIHTAALLKGEAMFGTNVDGSRNISYATVQLHAKLIYISSDVIFDGEHAPYDEKAPPNPISPYGESKARAELAVSEENPGAAIVRASLIYGFDPLDPRTQQTLNGEMPRLFTDEYRCPIFVNDLVYALIELTQSRYSGIINVAGPQRLSRYDLGSRLADAFRAPPRFLPALSATSPIRRPRDCSLDISLARKILRTPLRSVDDILKVYSM